MLLTTFVVDSPLDTTDLDGVLTLREAVEAANGDEAVGDAPAGNGADIIEFAFGLKVIELEDYLRVSSDLTIVGPDQGTEPPSLEIVAAGQVGPASTDHKNVFNVFPNGSLELSGVKLTGGSAYGAGGAISNRGTLTLTNSVLTDHVQSGGSNFNSGGGAISNGREAIATLRNVTISNSTALRGGAINNRGGEMLIEDSLLTGNSAVLDGGAIYNDGGTLTVVRTEIRGNTSSSKGGALLNRGDMTVRNSVLDGNASRFGGAIRNDKTLLVQASKFIENSALERGDGVGGAIYNTGTTVVGLGHFEGNRAIRGGAVANYGTVTIDASTMHANAAGKSGASSQWGGALYSTNKATVLRSTFSENTSPSAGGAIFGATGTIDIHFSTLSGNRASAGAGIYNNESTIEIINSTITANQTTGAAGGGGLRNYKGTVSIGNSILVGNTSSNGPEGRGTLEDLGNNLIGPTSALSFTGNGTGTRTAQKIRDVLAVDSNGRPVLQDNGGPTKTHLVNPNSVGIDSGDPSLLPVDSDQRGFPIRGVVDRGSYELANFTSQSWAYEAAGNQFGPGAATVLGFGFHDGLPDNASNKVPSEPLFLGFEFDTGPMKFGKIVDGVFGDKYGGELNADLAGQLGLELGFYVNSGTLDVNYGGDVHFIVDDPGNGQPINISSVLEVGQGGLYTVSPRVGAFADLVFELDARIAARGCLVGCVSVGSNFKADGALELLSVNRQLSDSNGDPLFHTNPNGTKVPFLDGEIRLGAAPLIQDLLQQDPEKEKTADRYQDAMTEEREATIEQMKAEAKVEQVQKDLDRAPEHVKQIHRDRLEAAKQKVESAKQRGFEATEKRRKVDQDVKDANKPDKDGKRKIGKPKLGVPEWSFDEAGGSLLGLEASLDSSFGIDQVASVSVNLGKAQLTLPDVQLTSIAPTDGGKLSASTDDFCTSGSIVDCSANNAQFRKLQLAAAEVDLGALLARAIGVPGGKINISAGKKIGGSNLINLGVTTVSYNLGPVLNVSQNIEATPSAQVRYDFSAPVIIDGETYGPNNPYMVPVGKNFKADPVGNDSVDVTPTMIFDTTIRNDIGLDALLRGKFDAFGFDLRVAGQKIVNVPPLVKHTHATDSFELASLLDKTFKLADRPELLLKPFSIGGLKSDGESPATALVGTPDSSNPNRTAITAGVQANTPVFVSAQLVDETGTNLYRSLQISTNRPVDKVTVFHDGLRLSSGSLITGSTARGTTYEIGGRTSFQLDEFQLEHFNGKSTAVVGLTFSSAGNTSVTLQRSEGGPVPKLDVAPPPAVRPTGLNDAEIEQRNVKTLLAGLDIDDDGKVSPLTDGVLVLRFLKGLRGTQLVTGAINPQGERTSVNAIEQYLETTIRDLLDADDDGVSGDGDGLLVLRHLAGFTGTHLTEGAVSPSGARSEAELIVEFLKTPKVENTASMNGTKDPSTAFQHEDIVDQTGRDLFLLDGTEDVDPNAIKGASAARPAVGNEVQTAQSRSSRKSRTGSLPPTKVFEFQLDGFADPIAYQDLYLRDADDSDDRSKWQLVSRSPEGAPMSFGDIDLGSLTDSGEVLDVSARLVKEQSQGQLGVDEPIFVELPDGAGSTYEALDSGVKFRTITIDFNTGGNVYLDPTFDLYLKQGDAWVYEATVSTEDSYRFAGDGVSEFQLFSMALPNDMLHRSFNQRAPDLNTTIGLTLATQGPLAQPPRLRVTQDLRGVLHTPDEATKPNKPDPRRGTPGNEYDSEIRLVREGSNAVAYIRQLPGGTTEEEVQLVQLASSAIMTIEANDHFDRLIIDTTQGPLRLPIAFYAGDGADGDEIAFRGSNGVLDLTAQSQITGVEIIDIRGGNKLIVDVDVVKNNDGTGETLRVITDNVANLTMGEGWQDAGTETIDAIAYHVYQQQSGTVTVTLKVSDPATVPAAPPIVPATVVTSAATAPQSRSTPTKTSVALEPVDPTDDETPTSTPQQMITAQAPDARAGENVPVTVFYSSSNGAGTTGLNLRMFFDSSQLAVESIPEAWSEGLAATPQLSDDGPGGGLDNDLSTDSYINFLWTDTDGSWSDGTQPVELYPANFVATDSFAGESVIHFRGTPAAGYELDAPSVTISQRPNLAPRVEIAAPRSSLAGQSVEFRFSASDEPADEAAGFTYDIDWNGDGSVDQTVPGGTAVVVPHVFTSPGEFDIGVTARDQLGAVSRPETHGLDVESNQPSLTISGPDSVPVEELLAVSLTATTGRRASFDNYIYDIDWDGDGTVDQSIQGPSNVEVTHTYTEPGQFEIILTATNELGGVSEPTIHRVQIANLLPTVRVSGPVTGVAGESLRFELGASDTGIDAAAGFSYAIDWDGDGQSEETVAGGTDVAVDHVFAEPGEYEIQVIVTDQHGGISDPESHSIRIGNEAPEAAIAGPRKGLVGQPLAFRFTVQDAADLTGGLTYEIDWDGDGQIDQTIQTESGGNGIATVDHLYSDIGLFQMIVTAVDQAGVSGEPATRNVNVRNELIRNDVAAFGGKKVLMIGGTPGRDRIEIQATRRGRFVQVLRDGVAESRYRSDRFGRIVAFGYGGNDVITVNPGLSLPSYLFGGEGKDRLTGGDSNDVVVGGAGRDRLWGGSGGRDILIGGTGRDVLRGPSPSPARQSDGGDSDIMIAGSTDYDASDEALIRIANEWRSIRSYGARANRLLRGAGKLPQLSAETVASDGDRDVLRGGADLDWFLFTQSEDVLQGRRRNERITSI